MMIWKIILEKSGSRKAAVLSILSIIDRGHNGINSIMGSIGYKVFPRMEIGIYRPLSRDPEDVASYVLVNFNKK